MYSHNESGHCTQLHGNPYAEGSKEWYAYGDGHDYAVLTEGCYDEPLSGEWADMPTISDVLDSVAVHLFGSGATWVDDIASELWVSEHDALAMEVLDAYERGYQNYREHNGLESDYDA